MEICLAWIEVRWNVIDFKKDLFFSFFQKMSAYYENKENLRNEYEWISSFLFSVLFFHLFSCKLPYWFCCVRCPKCRGVSVPAAASLAIHFFCKVVMMQSGRVLVWDLIACAARRVTAAVRQQEQSCGYLDGLGIRVM